MIDLLVTISVVLGALLAVGCIGWPILKRYNRKEPEMQRKWTDPKRHDRLN